MLRGGPVEMNPSSFYNTYLPLAQDVSRRTGLDPRLVLAQAALESGWGKGAAGGNFFGIKSHGRPNGQTLVTTEYQGGQYVPQEASFRTYDRPEQSFYDYGSFILDNPRYRAVMDAGSLQDQIAAMGASGYATDPEYSRKLSGIVEMFGADGGNMESIAQHGLLGPQPRPGDRRRDIAGALASGFNMLRRNPNQNLDASIAHQRQQRQSNRTADWLRSQPGGEIYAQMADMGRGAEGLAAYQAAKAGPEATAMQKNYEFLVAQGYSPQEALRAVQGGSVTNISTGTIPPGYQLITDPETGAQRMEAIPGGPAAAELAAADEAAAKADELAAKGESTVNRSVDFLIKAIDKKGLFDFPEAGVAGNLLAHLGVNQEAVDFRNELASLQAVIAFDRLQEMRNASKTGGALGSVSEKELTLLINAYGNLMQSTSSERLKENLMTIKRVMNDIESDPVASAMYYGTTAQAGATGDGFSVTGVVGQ